MAEICSKFHGEVKVYIGGGAEVRMNIFCEQREQLFTEIWHCLSVFAPQAAPAAAPAPAQEAPVFVDPARRAAQPAVAAAPQAPALQCAYCMSEDVEFITWKDSASGAQKGAHKCRQCGRWQRAAKQQTAETQKKKQQQ